MLAQHYHCQHLIRAVQQPGLLAPVLFVPGMDAFPKEDHCFPKLSTLNFLQGLVLNKNYFKKKTIPLSKQFKNSSSAKVCFKFTS